MAWETARNGRSGALREWRKMGKLDKGNKEDPERGGAVMGFATQWGLFRPESGPAFAEPRRGPGRCAAR